MPSRLQIMISLRAKTRPDFFVAQILAHDNTSKMQHIDQDPEGSPAQQRYGKWTGRVNRRLCRWAAFAGFGYLLWFAWHYRDSGMSGAHALFGVVGFGIGGLLILSLKSTDW